MTATYDLTTSIGKVRLNIGDTTIANAFFSNEEIQVYLTTESGDINLASADCLEAMAAAYALNADSETIGTYKFSQQNVDKLLKLAERYRGTDESVPYQTWSEMDLESLPDSATEE